MGDLGVAAFQETSIHDAVISPDTGDDWADTEVKQSHRKGSRGHMRP